MRQATGQAVTVNGRSLYAERSGQGPDWVVFEAGSGQGRTAWDPVLPHLTDRARLVTYDRAGFGRSGRTRRQLSIDDMAADLVALIDAVVPRPARVVLVGHSMGGLITRRAAEHLGARLAGLLLIDPTPEQAPTYDTFDQIARQVDRFLAVGQALIWLPPVARLTTGKVRRVYPRDTYQAMRAEDFTPAGFGQTRKEIKAVATAIHQFRAQPPTPPTCPTIVLSASREFRRTGNQQVLSEYQRRWAEALPDGRFELIDSAHLIHAEQPGIVADRLRHLLDRAGQTTSPRPTHPLQA